MCIARDACLFGLALYTVTDNRDCVQRVALGRPIPAVYRKPGYYVQNTNQDAAVIDRNARYSFRVQILTYPTCIQGPIRRFPSEYCHAVWYGKTRVVGLPDGEKNLTKRLFVLTECTNVTDTWTHRRTDTA